VPEPVYEAAVTQLKTLGYATDKLRRVPQQWPEDAEAVPKR
jgi:apolipoprotein D and lipocalin family protein